MKRKWITVLATLLVPAALLAQQSGNTSEKSRQSGDMTSRAAKVGDMSRTEFERVNREGAAKVASFKPSSGNLSAQDRELMMQVATGGMKQLTLSQVAARKAERADIRELALAEVEEQSGLAAKLKEMAAAKGMELPSEPDEQTTQMLQRFEGLSGDQVSQFYLSESGVKGHEELEKTMTEVQAKAQDNDLKRLAATALPLVRTHLKVARAMIPNSVTGNKK